MLSKVLPVPIRDRVIWMFLVSVTWIPSVLGLFPGALMSIFEALTASHFSNIICICCALIIFNPSTIKFLHPTKVTALSTTNLAQNNQFPFKSAYACYKHIYYDYNFIKKITCKAYKKIKIKSYVPLAHVDRAAKLKNKTTMKENEIRLHLEDY